MVGHIFPFHGEKDASIRSHCRIYLICAHNKCLQFDFTIPNISLFVNNSKSCPKIFMLSKATDIFATMSNEIHKKNNRCSTFNSILQISFHQCNDVGNGCVCLGSAEYFMLPIFPISPIFTEISSPDLKYFSDQSRPSRTSSET